MDKYGRKDGWEMMRELADAESENINDMDEPTEEQLKIIKKDIMSGRVMIVEVKHYKRLTDNLDKSYDFNKMLQERIKELEIKLKEYGNHKANCAYIQGLRGNSIEKCDCGFEQALEGG